MNKIIFMIMIAGCASSSDDVILTMKTDAIKCVSERYESSCTDIPEDCRLSDSKTTSCAILTQYLNTSCKSNSFKLSDCLSSATAFSECDCKILHSISLSADCVSVCPK